jgi:hypothetical protein
MLSEVPSTVSGHRLTAQPCMNVDAFMCFFDAYWKVSAFDRASRHLRAHLFVECRVAVQVDIEEEVEHALSRLDKLVDRICRVVDQVGILNVSSAHARFHLN